MADSCFGEWTNNALPCLGGFNPDPQYDQPFLMSVPEITYIDPMSTWRQPQDQTQTLSSPAEPSTLPTMKSYETFQDQITPPANFSLAMYNNAPDTEVELEGKDLTHFEHMGSSWSFYGGLNLPAAPVVTEEGHELTQPAMRRYQRKSTERKEQVKSATIAAHVPARARKRRNTSSASTSTTNSTKRWTAVNQPSTPSSSPGSDPENTTSTNQTSPQRSEALERNRQAAQKCREKKREWINRLEETCTKLTYQHKGLVDEARHLKEVVLLLKDKILEHAGCGTPEIDAFLAHCAAGVVTNWDEMSQAKAQMGVTLKHGTQNGDIAQPNVEGRNGAVNKELC